MSDSKTTEKAKKADPKIDDGLVTVTKGDETLRVHPTTVDSHKRAGWSFVAHANVPLPPQPENPVA